MIESMEPKIVLSTALTAVQTVHVSDGTDTLYNDGSVNFTPDANHPGATILAYDGTQQVVQMVAAGGGIITRFSQGGTYFSLDGRNIGGGGNTVSAYEGNHNIVAMVGVANGGVDTLLGDGKVYYSPDGLNLGGGGSTVLAYTGGQFVVQMVGAGGGVDTLFDGGGVYFSPDGLNLGGGGNSVRAYSGTQHVIQIASAGGGVDTLFDQGRVYFSPTGMNLGGGAATTLEFDGSQGTVLQLVSVAGGVDINFDAHPQRYVYFSPDGLNLGGGGHTVYQPSATNITAAGVGVLSVVNGSGFVYFSRTGTNLVDGNSIRVDQGQAKNIVEIVPAGGGVDVFTSQGTVYFSPDGLNLGGGGDTTVAFSPSSTRFLVTGQAASGIDVPSVMRLCTSALMAVILRGAATRSLPQLVAEHLKPSPQVLRSAQVLWVPTTTTG